METDSQWRIEEDHQDWVRMSGVEWNGVSVSKREREREDESCRE